MPLLKALTVAAAPVGQAGAFPFNVPALRPLRRLDFAAPVTFFVGENGSGKSTLLAAIASAAGAVTAGRESAATDASLAAVRAYAATLRLAWSRRTRRGFFLRAEDFFGYVQRLNQTRAELERDLRAVDAEYAGRSDLAASLARLPHQRELAELERRYGPGLDARSHGESFLAFFQARLAPQGLHLLDEPEAPLSPARQLAFLAALKPLVAQGAQFIIATHSPLLLAFPDAVILSFDDGVVRPARYADLEHVTLTRDFLNHPEAYLRRL